MLGNSLVDVERFKVGHHFFADWYSGANAVSPTPKRDVNAPKRRVSIRVFDAESELQASSMSGEMFTCKTEFLY